MNIKGYEYFHERVRRARPNPRGEIRLINIWGNIEYMSPALGEITRARAGVCT